MGHKVQISSSMDRVIAMAEASHNNCLHYCTFSIVFLFLFITVVGRRQLHSHCNHFFQITAQKSSKTKLSLDCHLKWPMPGQRSPSVVVSFYDNAGQTWLRKYGFCVLIKSQSNCSVASPRCGMFKRHAKIASMINTSLGHTKQHIL